MGFENLCQHTKLTLAKGVKQQTQCLLGGNFFVGAGIALYKMISTFFTLISLFFTRFACFDDFVRFTVFAVWHNGTPPKFGDSII